MNKKDMSFSEGPSLSLSDVTLLSALLKDSNIDSGDLRKTPTSRLNTIRYFFDCHAYLTDGACAYNDQCKYAHGPVELSDRIAMARDDKTLRARELRGTCRAYSSTETCKFGEK